MHATAVSTSRGDGNNQASYKQLTVQPSPSTADQLTAHTSQGLTANTLSCNRRVTKYCQISPATVCKHADTTNKHYGVVSNRV